MLRHRVEDALSPPFSLTNSRSLRLKCFAEGQCRRETCPRRRNEGRQHSNTATPKNQPSASQKQHYQPTRAGFLSCDQNLPRSFERAPRSLTAPPVLLSHLHQPINFLTNQETEFPAAAQGHGNGHCDRKVVPVSIRRASKSRPTA